jgi:hypothetical protein
VLSNVITFSSVVNVSRNKIKVSRPLYNLIVNGQVKMLDDYEVVMLKDGGKFGG